MYASEFCNFSYWWIFPIIMIVLCFFMMRSRRWPTMCGFGPRNIDNHQTERSDSALEILDKRYASGEIDKDKYEEKKNALYIMKYDISNLVDYDNPTVKDKALILTQGHETTEEKIAAIFYYVRDDIKFQFPNEGDLVSASQLIKYGYGYCNNKTTLFLALCRAIGIEARMHFSLIDKKIQRGLIRGLFYWIIPQKLSHSWLEVKLDNKWFPIDSYINDTEYYNVAKKELRDKGWNTGYSIACSKNESSIALDFDNEQFVQMDAVTDDHGVYDDPVEYYRSPKYRNRPNALTLFIYKIFISGVNKRVRKMRYA